jgi:hypothetical protein
MKTMIYLQIISIFLSKFKWLQVNVNTDNLSDNHNNNDKLELKAIKLWEIKIRF